MTDLTVTLTTTVPQDMDTTTPRPRPTSPDPNPRVTTVTPTTTTTTPQDDHERVSLYKGDRSVLACPQCDRQVSELLPDRCAGCIDLDQAEARIREEFGPVAVVDDAR